ncbi:MULTISPECIES: phosphoribulokinase [Pseudidiomarina]|uniref:Phosphoribulokinase n=2 Tax=Pseudidiomarina TaxID=2800384 RepID=A0A0K6H3A8_9GAMM|nr:MULTISPECIES: phosphoribulokinase [Pseudidiomarina]RUO48570.1 phosphoribulokinase [Pseudidiomarina donghaiensis]CUA85477.1 Phosphoribulokinase [Pseudidiomarina woesei]SFV23980.1 phosphoribulokinase [Pseudidiomarina donghaiensis]
MSIQHPIIAVTGSSGAGTTTTSQALRHIFRSLDVEAACVEGDSFHRYSRPEMELAIRKAQEQGRHISYFGPEANDFARLEALFRQYGATGNGEIRRYLHSFDDAVPYNQVPGTFTPWEPLPADTDLLFYEGLHGGVAGEGYDVAQHVDLLIGMVPIVNLEWIQKLLRDTSERGHSREAVTQSIVRSMEDYIHHIVPQFSRTHINFQRVPTVDTSNPFSAKDIPSLDESFVVIRFRGMKNVDFPYYLRMIDGAFMSRMNTLVVPGGKMVFAMELILAPLIEEILDKQRNGGHIDWLSR